MQDRFNLGIFSSASSKTVNVAREMLELAAGPGRPLFPKDILILHRVHTISASVDHKLNGGKDWDTMKPLHCYFSRIHQTLLVDDDAFKVSKPLALSPSSDTCFVCCGLSMSLLCSHCEGIS